MLNDSDERRRIQDSVHDRLRCVPVGDDGFRRSRAARYDVSRAARRHVHARPADLGVRRPGRLGARSGRAAERRMQAVSGGADRAGRPRSKLPAFVHADGSRKFRDYPDFIVNFETEPGSGHRLSRRLARQGRRRDHARRAEPAAVGDVRGRTTASSTTCCRSPTSTCATATGAISNGRSACACGAFGDPILIQIYSEVMQTFRLAGEGGDPAEQPPAHLRATRREVLRSAAVLLSAARKPGVRSRALSAECRDTTPDGDVSLVGLAERLAASDPRAQLSVRQSRELRAPRHRRRRLDVGRIRCRPRPLHVPATARRSSPARCGRGTPSARLGRLASGRRRERVAARFHAESPDLR